VRIALVTLGLLIASVGGVIAYRALYLEPPAAIVISDKGVREVPNRTRVVGGGALQLTQPPVAKAEMLIRKPVAEVFEAFIDPEVTRKFWFTKSTGRLEVGKQITWTWEMYDHSVQVIVKAIEVNKRILIELIEWGNYGSMSTVEWIFSPYENDLTYVTITNSGFQGDGDKVVKDALDSKGGFTWVLAGLKALLEHHLELNAIADAFPPGLEHG
jgi:uncharacterized protein YndB with AHSA1/START domain